MRSGRTQSPVGHTIGANVSNHPIYTFTFSIPSEGPDEVFRDGQCGMEELLTLIRILKG